MRHHTRSSKPAVRAGRLFDSMITSLDVIDTAIEKIEGNESPRNIIKRESFILREFSEALREVVMEYYARSL